MILQQ